MMITAFHDGRVWPRLGAHRRPNRGHGREVFPKTERKRPLLPNESLISIEKAQRVLGYKPQFDWTPPKRAKAKNKS